MSAVLSFEHVCFSVLSVFLNTDRVLLHLIFMYFGCGGKVPVLWCTRLYVAATEEGEITSVLAGHPPPFLPEHSVTS